VTDLSARTCVVTGANSGIGYETVRALARMGARVVMVCRDPGRGEAARAALARETGNARLELEIADLSSRAAVRALAHRLGSRCDRLDVLVNNAGTWSSSRQETADGIERTWATNQLAYFLLTEGLRPLLVRSAPARIVNVASDLARGLDLDDVEFRRRPYEGVAAYAQSKQANRMWTWALARRLEVVGRRRVREAVRQDRGRRRVDGRAARVEPGGRGRLGPLLDRLARGAVPLPRRGAGGGALRLV
jgi:NAD(P)-dependent dehydrogenase (short-subunit alcohol dehydrogenase family)